MKWGIICDTDEELAYIINIMHIQSKHFMYGCLFYSGILSNEELVVVKKNIDSITTAVYTNILIHDYAITLLISTGYAKALTNTVNTFDVILAKKIMPLYYLKNRHLNRYPSPNYDSNMQLLKLAKKAAKSIGIIHKLHIGTIISKELSSTYEVGDYPIILSEELLCLDFDGNSIEEVAYLSKIPYLIIRTIGNNLIEKAITPDKKYNYSVELILEMITKYSNGFSMAIR